MTNQRACIALAGLALVGLAGCTGDHDSDSAGGHGRVVEVDMTDNAFDPTGISADVGETITFRFTNNGNAVHEAVVGDDEFQDEHHREMADTAASDDGSGSDSAAMGEHGDDSSAADHPSSPVRLDPGETGDLIYTFDEDGTMVIGCHEPGHWEAGMKAEVKVG